MICDQIIWCKSCYLFVDRENFAVIHYVDGEGMEMNGEDRGDTESSTFEFAGQVTGSELISGINADSR